MRKLIDRILETLDEIADVIFPEPELVPIPVKN